MNVTGTATLTRCPWSEATDEYRAYHDLEWGAPLRDSRQLFELLMLEGMQAGLSWRLILERRPQLRKAFKGFHPGKLAKLTVTDVDTIIELPGVIRHRGKIQAVLDNAKAYLAQNQKIEFSKWLWGFVDDAPVVNRWRSIGQVPAKTETSDAMARALKKAGFRFVGPTITYAFMQASGMVNDHLIECFRHSQVQRPR